METQESNQGRAGTPGRKRWKRYLIWSGAVAASYLLAYGVGYFVGRAELATAVAKNVALSNELTKSQDAATRALDTESGLVQRLEARRCLDQAIGALDARNFGIAEERLKQAAQRLLASKSDGALLELGRTLESFKLVATEDLGAQRSKLVTFVSTFDQAYPAR